MQKQKEIFFSIRDIRRKKINYRVDEKIVLFFLFSIKSIRVMEIAVRGERWREMKKSREK